MRSVPAQRKSPVDPRPDPRAETDATVTLDAKTGKVTGAAKVAGATDKAFTAPTDVVSTGDTYFCVVEFYNSKLDQETAYAKSEGVTVKVNAAPAATMTVVINYELNGTVIKQAPKTVTESTTKGYAEVTADAISGYNIVSANPQLVPFAANGSATVTFVVETA